MLTFSQIKLKPFNLPVFWLILGFFALRLISFLLNPSLSFSSSFTLILLLLFILCYLKNKSLAFLLLFAEYLLGGAGHFFELGGIALRTWLTIDFLLLYFTYFLVHKKYQTIKIEKNILFLIITFYCLLILAGILGYYHQHSFKFIIQDFLPFIFLLLFIPATEFLKDQKVQKFIKYLIFAFIISSALWALFNFILFTSQTAILHHAYYNWLRDFALAKITLVTPSYWRIVFPEQILLVPLFLVIANFYLIKKENIYLWVLLFLNLILALNISRAYFLGLGLAWIFLLFKNKFKHWWKLSLINLLIFLTIFIGLNLTFSKGQDSGLAILGLRINSIQQPELETSTTNRLELLAPIISLIKQQPLTGQGLGQDLNFINSKQEWQNTRQFDWGYLEMWLKWGLLALINFLLIIFYILKNNYQINKKQPLYWGLFISWLALLIINLTTPALFHVLIIIYLAFNLVLIANQKIN